MINLKIAREAGVLALGGFVTRGVCDCVWTPPDTANVQLLPNVSDTVSLRPLKKVIHRLTERYLLAVRDRAAGKDGIPCALATQGACRRTKIEAVVEPQAVVIFPTSAGERAVPGPRKDVAIEGAVEIVALAGSVAAEQLTHPDEEI
eukprot:3554783-Rhodomonas_salina.2